MPYPIENKLVIAVASSALFDLTESDKVFREKGEAVYRAYQEENLNVPFDKFTFQINIIMSEKQYGTNDNNCSYHKTQYHFQMLLHYLDFHDF